LLELAEQDVEAGEVYALENNRLAYYRAADGSPALRLGVGTAPISPEIGSSRLKSSEPKAAAPA
jgi:hypothetical protein